MSRGVPEGFVNLRVNTDVSIAHVRLTVLINSESRVHDYYSALHNSMNTGPNFLALALPLPHLADAHISRHRIIHTPRVAIRI